MKRYALFEFYRYYPAGGWNDFVDSFDSAAEAADFHATPGGRFNQGSADARFPGDYYFQVVDLTTGEVVEGDPLEDF